MMHKQKGFVLLSFILILGFSTLFILATVESLVSQLKIIQDQKNNFILLQNFESAAFSLAKANLRIGQGEIKIKNQVFHYKAKALGLYPCLIINNEMGSHHWLIEITTLDEKPVTLELRFANSAAIKEQSCLLKRKIKAGIQSWIFQLPHK